MLNVTLVTTPTNEKFIYSALENNASALNDFKSNQNNVWKAVAFTGCLGHIKDFNLKTKGNKMKETLIYGLERNENRLYMESLLAHGFGLDIDDIKNKASAMGYHSFRIAYFNNEKPNFKKALNYV